jgi:hypothetical protein
VPAPSIGAAFVVIRSSIVRGSHEPVEAYSRKFCGTRLANLRRSMWRFAQSLWPFDNAVVVWQQESGTLAATETELSSRSVFDQKGQKSYWRQLSTLSVPNANVGAS